MVGVGPSRVGAGALLVVMALLGGAPIQPASAAFPGANGKIAFWSNRDAGNPEVYVMNADGSGQTNLTNHPGLDSHPAWSPDGTKIAFGGNRVAFHEVWVMNANGSNVVNLTNNSVYDHEPAWSPDGTKIAFTSYRDGDFEVYVMNADGSGQTNLTNNASRDDAPAWSPDGTKIAFQSTRDGDFEVWMMNADGSNPTNLTQNAVVEDGEPSWSPDGSRIAFYTNRDLYREIYVMNSDGSGQTNITQEASGDDWGPAWSPDGSRIAFKSDRDGNDEVYVMNADGSGQVNLSNNAATDADPDWQPTRLPKAVALKAKPKKVEKGEKTRLTATVTPCGGHEGDLVEFYRKQKLIATKASTADCVAKLKTKVKKTTKFHAISPEQDADHLAGESKIVKVKILSAG